MKIISIYIIALFLSITYLEAEEELGYALQDREHSVKKTIQKVLDGPAKEVSSTTEFKSMFRDAKVTGQIELIYSNHQIQDDENHYATAIGGHLLYELASLNGFNAGIEFSTAQDISALTGDGDKTDSELSSEEGSYTEATQAFLNYKKSGLNLRVGRQLIDTPLADSDDRRIIDNSFEALSIAYDFDELTFIAAYLDRWQGVDLGPDSTNPWQNTGDNGTYFAGLMYSVKLFDASIWYYNMSESKNPTNVIGNIANQSIYTDISFNSNIKESVSLHYSFQYLNQKEEKNSGIEASVYGVLFETIFYEKFAFSVAYNQAEKKSNKGIFSGYGGGTLYTNMDKTLLTDIATDRDAQAIVAGISYDFNDIGFLYAYGDFNGNSDSSGQKEHIIEQNIGLQYSASKELIFGVICTLVDDKKDTGSAAYYNGGTYENYRLVTAYKF